MADIKRAERKDGRFEVKITEDGKRISKYFESSAEANAWRTQQKALQLQGITLIPDRVPFGILAQAWLEAKKGDVRQTTSESYRYLYDHHIKEEFADKTPQQVADGWQNYINKMKKNYSASTTIKLNFLIKAVMEVALDRDLIRKLPRIIGLPSPVKRQPEPMTIDQIKILIRASAKSRYSPILWLELSTGLRRGEILALEWTDLSGNSVSVTKSLEVTRDKGLVIQPPKTKAGKRKIDIEPVIMKKIQAMPIIRTKAPDGKTVTSKIVFCTTNGTYLSPTNFSKRFRSWVRVADKLIYWENIKRRRDELEEIPPITGRRFHDLRHQFGSLLADLGVHPSVAKRLTGHAKEDMVLHYTNPNAALSKEASQLIGAQMLELLD